MGSFWSGAMLALEEGVGLAVVQEMLGHSDIWVTRGYTNPRELHLMSEFPQVAC
jgi:site-specific recombinase XerD